MLNIVLYYNNNNKCVAWFFNLAYHVACGLPKNNYFLYKNIDMKFSQYYVLSMKTTFCGDYLDFFKNVFYLKKPRMLIQYKVEFSSDPPL